MPLLAAEPTYFPETLFADPAYAAAGPARWWVLYTKARAEKTVARHLLGREVAFYLPQYKQTWRTGGRMRTSYLPLFTGYVFLHGDESGRVAALESNLLSAVLSVTDQERLYADLVRVERLLGGSVPVAPEVVLPVGVPVEITHGPFRGLRGTVVKRDGANHFVVTVEFLRRGVSIPVDGAALRPVEPTSRPSSATGV